MLTPRFALALTTAYDLHAHQVRKGTSIPYVAHLLGVTSIALHHGADEDEAIGALLHDAIEDAPPHLGARGVRDLIRDRFGERVLAIVEGCTDTDVVPKPTWRVRKEAYVAHVSTQPPSVLLVSASDKLHNAGAILSDLRVIGDEVWRRFSRDAGKPGVIGYYRGLVIAFRATGRHPRLVDELDATVTAIETATGVRGVWPAHPRESE
jgi:GTP pyrophosphokinase